MILIVVACLESDCRQKPFVSQIQHDVFHLQALYKYTVPSLMGDIYRYRFHKTSDSLWYRCQVLT